MVTLTLAPGDVLCREGETADDIYFVGSGALRAEVASGDGGPSRRPLTMRPGTALGEIALLDGGPRSATVVADEPSEVRALGFAALAEVGVLHPGLTATLYRNPGRLLAWRLRRAEQVRALER
jgi:glutaminase